MSSPAEPQSLKNALQFGLSYKVNDAIEAFDVAYHHRGTSSGPKVARC